MPLKKEPRKRLLFYCRAKARLFSRPKGAGSLCSQIVVLLPAAYLLSLTGRLELVWLAFPIAEVVSVILNATFLRLTYRASLERK